jgi:hypothetical protein
LAGRRSQTTMTVKPAKASKITARAQNTWHRLAARLAGLLRHQAKLCTAC